MNITAEKLSIKTAGSQLSGGGWNLFSRGEIGEYFELEQGTYRFTATLKGSPAAGMFPLVELRDGRWPPERFSVTADWVDYSTKIQVVRGTHRIVIAFLNDTVINGEDRNLHIKQISIERVMEQVGRKLDYVADELVAEGAALSAARERIEKIRKVDVQLTVAPNAPFQLQLKRHRFRFGCNAFMLNGFSDPANNALYKQRFLDVFNHAVVKFMWAKDEPVQGDSNYAYSDQAVAWANANNLTVKGHNILWGASGRIPAWASESDRISHIKEMMQRFPLVEWDVINEPSHLPMDMSYYRVARQADPFAKLIINDYNQFEDGGDALFQLLQDSNTIYDAIGFQSHETGWQWFEPAVINAALDKFSIFGKEIHITEFCPASDGKPILMNHRDGIWNEQAQADYAEEFYTLAFAHPSVTEINWWDLTNNPQWRNEACLLRADFSPKLAYERLRKLIHETWSTTVSGVSDADGKISFRGFPGIYEGTVGEKTVSLAIGRLVSNAKDLQL